MMKKNADKKGFRSSMDPKDIEKYVEPMMVGNKVLGPITDAELKALNEWLKTPA
jgi:hypothetical protein